MLVSTATIGWLTKAHWKGYTTSSPNLSFLKRGQIVYDYVPTGVKISIKGVSTMLTNKVRLVNSVGMGNVSTPTTLELFKNDYSTSRNKANYLLSYLVIYMPPKPFLLLRNLFKMSFSRRSAFGGKSFSKCIIPLRYSFYVSTIKKLVYFSILSNQTV